MLDRVAQYAPRVGHGDAGHDGRRTRRALLSVIITAHDGVLVQGNDRQVVFCLDARQMPVMCCAVFCWRSPVAYDSVALIRDIHLAALELELIRST